MTRTGRRAALLLAAAPLLPLCLTACGDEPADDGTPAADTAADAAPHEELVERALALETTVDMVYVTEAPGFTLAVQSVGPLNADGFQSSYTDDGGAVLHLMVDHAPDTAADGDPCPALRAAAGDMSAACEADEDGAWLVTTEDGTRTLSRLDGTHLVSVAATESDADTGTLRTALTAAHQADDAELTAVLPEATTTEPVERGDLPATGDGAPQDPVDPESASG
ncbi:hypothetical protein [Streptomyces sp. RFCAC02]|uniref:hypothetical protein n=1 Tax=Streptomyces sp. RFCAC02 TaxID=2499143 RepID=UPI0010211DF4|nr:hypothetical protein [Streptomyces sp. RFCAC02]